MANYVLSTGEITKKEERYVLDLFKIFLRLYPLDVPGSDVGFDYFLGDTKKDELKGKILRKAQELVSKVKEKAPKNVDMSIESIDILSYSEATIKIRAGIYEEDIMINI